MRPGNEPEQAVFAALADPTRRALLRSIASGEASTPTELAALLPVTRQAVSKHLALLEQARLVDAERSGREVRFQATPAPLGDAIAWMTAVGARWDERLAALAETVAEGRDGPTAEPTQRSDDVLDPRGRRYDEPPRATSATAGRPASRP